MRMNLHPLTWDEDDFAVEGGGHIEYLPPDGVQGASGPQCNVDLPPIAEEIGPPVAQMTGIAKDVALDEDGGTTSALAYARKVSPKIIRKLAEIALGSPNHHAARAAGRDVLQIAGMLQENSRIDVVVTMRGIFAQMTATELDDFLAQKVLPERLKGEAMKLLQHGAIG